MPAEATHRARAAELSLLLASILALLLALSKGLGVTWDETIYFLFSDTVARWAVDGADLSADAVSRAWAYDTFANPHPPLFKILDALTAIVSAEVLPFPLNYRLAHLAYVSGCLVLVYWASRKVASRSESLAALAMVTLAPRVLGDLLLANCDGPVMISWLAAVVVAWRIAEAPAEQPLRRLRALLFVICAVAGATKFTGLLITIPVAAYFGLRRRWLDVAVVALALLGALALTIAISPDKWSHPLPAVSEYLSYPFRRSSIPIATTYLGRYYAFHLPWHYFLVMSVLTFPVPLWLCLPGLTLCPPRLRTLAQAAVLSVGFWLLLVHLPGTPRHDGVRQFVAIYPLLALLGWIGLLGYRRRLVEERPRFAGWRSAGIVLAVPLALAVTTARSHPHELSYYNFLGGGIRGAEALGLEITYYFDALDDRTLRALEAHVRPGERVGMSPMWPRLLETYRDHGRLRMDFTVVGPMETSEWLLLYRRRHFYDDNAYTRFPAVHEVSHEGVSLLKLVRRPVGGSPPGR